MNEEYQMQECNLFDEEEIHRHCTVQVLRNSVNGQVSNGWREEATRCKDCRHFRKNAHGVIWCNEFGGKITPDDFCSRGDQEERQ